ncbi:hypothetical protein [Streptomyces johnsoniae]|uniref:Uncharacterized protein n=1 Tax=Streptomyces johnsoniae TaxID=3075532 RepID=A0ABU2S6S0_9ACTN|nr:hypothetical protein [Streptomyces sp. DSM 41886]MDT0444677.1 hypothetical protein [Streptomyces sp. DSM 41886]
MGIDTPADSAMYAIVTGRRESPPALDPSAAGAAGAFDAFDASDCSSVTIAFLRLAGAPFWHSGSQ